MSFTFHVEGRRLWTVTCSQAPDIGLQKKKKITNILIDTAWGINPSSDCKWAGMDAFVGNIILGQKKKWNTGSN